MVIDSFREEERQFVLKILPLLGQPFTSDRLHNYENISREIGFDRCKKRGGSQSLKSLGVEMVKISKKIKELIVKIKKKKYIKCND